METVEITDLPRFREDAILGSRARRGVNIPSILVLRGKAEYKFEKTPDTTTYTLTEANHQQDALSWFCFLKSFVSNCGGSQCPHAKGLP